MGEKIGYGISALLLLLVLGLCFWINIYFGLAVLLFVLGVFWWIYGKRKKRVDRTLLALAQEMNLDVEKSALKYFRVKGEYRGYPVEIGVHKRVDAWGGVGTILTSLTGEAGWSALDIQNFMGIKLVHNLDLPEERLISKSFPYQVTGRNEIYGFFPDVFPTREEIKRGLNRLAKAVDELKRL